MPSPFPGMDPYREAPNIWPDLHDALAGEIRGALNASLPAPYYARLEMRPEIGIVEDEPTLRRIVPDVAVVRRPTRPAESGVAVAEAPRTRVSKSLPLDLQFVFSSAYDRGPYRRGAVDYSHPPDVSLPSDLADWMDECLQAAGLR